MQVMKYQLRVKDPIHGETLGSYNRADILAVNMSEARRSGFEHQAYKLDEDIKYSVVYRPVTEASVRQESQVYADEFESTHPSPDLVNKELAASNVQCLFSLLAK